MIYPPVSSTESVWQLADGQSLRHKLWGDEAVLFNELSGDTHLVDADVIDVLLALQAGSATIGELCQRLGVVAETDERVASILKELRRLALVDCRAC